MQDRAERLRTRSIGVRVTEADFGRLHSLADVQGKPLGEWARDALLALAQHPAGTAVEQALLAEVFTSEGRVTREQMLTYIERADATKLTRAIEVLERIRAGTPAAVSTPDRGASP